MPLACLIALLVAQPAAPADFAWTGTGQYRVLVRVDAATKSEKTELPSANGSPRIDERPAEVRIEFARLLAQAGIDAVPDLASVQVIRHDPATGQPLRQGRFAFGRSEYDVPWRWYDAAIPYEFPDSDGNLATNAGKLRWAEQTRSGYFFECVGDARDGRLALVHRDDGQPAWYAMYFDVLPAGKTPERSPPRGFVGDGLNRCEPVGHSTAGLIHSRAEVADLDGDELPDLLLGCSRGNVVWYPNIGRPNAWRFATARLLFTRDGKPIDVGEGSAPRMADFDGDGRADLLCGGERNRIVWYRNAGDAKRAEFDYMGLVTADGRPLELPVTPVPEGPDVFKLDYYPVLDTVDWDGDGDVDLLAGGFVTGRIYLYENTAGPKTAMALRSVGELKLESGEAIDVGWAAAPSVADLDGDGDLDLVSGCMPMTAGGGDSVSSDKFLWYFENVGSRTAPKLRQSPFPKQGEFPVAALATPRLVDFDADGDYDIVASANMRVYLFKNTGDAQHPQFAAHADAMPGEWGSAPLAGTQFFDFNGDGLLDAIDAPRVYLNTGRGSPGIFASSFSLLKPGVRIDHLSGKGDDWIFQRLYDLDADGQLDLMDADHGGHFWWHRNRATTTAADFDPQGVQLSLADGSPLVIAPERTGFDALQGARATYTVGDFDNDGRADLVTADTFGEVLYFCQQPGAGDAPHFAARFEPSRKIAKLRIRAVPVAADWNGDGQLDVVAGSSAEDVVAILGNKHAENAASRFAAPQPIRLPPAPAGAGAPIVVTDYNGDGDLDLIVHTAYGYSCFYERSFIEGGYARGVVEKVEQRGR